MFAEPGTRFYLLAATTPVKIILYRDTQVIGEADGFLSGLELGPFCEAFTRWSATPLNGSAGSVLVGIGDDPMSYNPVAGTLSFSNPSANASAIVSRASVTSGIAFSAIFSIPAQATGMNLFQIEAGGFANPKTITVKKIVLRNTTAAAQIYNIGKVASQLGGALGTVNAQNLQSGGAASAFSFSTSDTGANPPGVWTYAFSRQVDPNSELEIDLTDNPLVCPAGIVAYPTIYCTTVNSPIAGEVIWEET